MKLSDQSVMALMMALQNSLRTQSDIVPMLKEWNLFMKDGEIFVENPPIVETEESDEDAADYFAENSDEDVLDFLTNPEDDSEDFKKV